MTTAPTSVPGGHAAGPLRVIGVAALVVIAAGAVVLVALEAGDRGSGSPGVLEGSGTAVAETRDVAAFTSVDLAGSNIVSIRVGADQRVEVRGDDNLVGLVTTDVRDGELVVDAQDASFQTNAPMSVVVTVPTLDGISLSGSGTITVEGVDAQAFAVRLPGSGTVRVSGTTARLEATLGGSGDLFLQDLVAAQAKAIVSGSGVVQLTATEALDAAISGSGTIMYAGDPPDVTRNVSGSGAIVAQ